MTLDLTRLICSKLRENVCFCAHHPPTPPKKIYLARRDNGLYCDVKEACIYKKKQRRASCQSWRTLIRLFLSFPIHTLYQWHSSSSAFVRDRDQIDFHTLSSTFIGTGMWGRESVNSRANFDLITYSCAVSLPLSLLDWLCLALIHIITAQKIWKNMPTVIYQDTHRQKVLN